jgi:hypothetical protein
MEPPASSFCELVSSTTGIESRRVQLQLEKPRRFLLSPIQSNPLRSVKAVEKEGRPSPSNSILAEPTMVPDGYGTLLRRSSVTSTPPSIVDLSNGGDSPNGTKQFDTANRLTTGVSSKNVAFRRVISISSSRHLVKIHLLFTRPPGTLGDVLFRTDRGTKYLPLYPWLKKKGTRHEKTVPFTPQQNGKAERYNRMIGEGARPLLYSNKALPLQLLAEAVNSMIYVLNRSLSTV